jgi:hypothetical protein
VRASVVVLLATLAVVVGPAGAVGTPPQPLAVSAASPVQDGQDVVWQVEMAQPFAPGGLARDHVSLCLLIRSSFRPWLIARQSSLASE